jgi:hypothetical protein
MEGTDNEDSQLPVKRKIQESMTTARSEAHNALELGFEVLGRIRQQGASLMRSNDLLTPIAGLSHESSSLMGRIISNTASGRWLFAILALITVVILWLVIRWKSSK